MQHLRSYKLSVQFYREAKGVKLPAHLKDQLRRASSSIALNLSEGTGKQTMPDQLRFFSIAMGSIRECQSIMEIEREAFSDDQRDLLDHLAASTFKLIRNAPHRGPQTAYRTPQPAYRPPQNRR